MLRITIRKKASTSRFVIEGVLAGPWVEELLRSWEMSTQIEKKNALIDLIDVTHIDSQGKALLTEMHRQGARLLAKGLLTQAIVEEIQGNGK